MNTTKTGLVPDEDTGTIFVTISANPGTSQERTKQIVAEVDKMLANNPAILHRNARTVPAASLTASSAPSTTRTRWLSSSILTSRTRCLA